MDASVDDFLNEINEIVPKKDKKQIFWKECLDEGSGYHYYWHLRSNEVTWSKPAEFIPLKESPRHPTTPTRAPTTPTRAPSSLFPPSNNFKPDSVIIYKVGDRNQKINAEPVYQQPKYEAKVPTKPVISKPLPKTNLPLDRKRFMKPGSDSEDEKIVLISSYGSDSESDEEEVQKKDDINQNINPQQSIINRMQTNPRLLYKTAEPKRTNNDFKQKADKNNDKPAGLSLVAGYSDSEEEQELENHVPVPVPEPKISHSTLFPVTQPINVKDFIPPLPSDKPLIENSPSQEFDNKAFQRKRRIGIALVNTAKRSKDVPELPPDSGKKGFGFKPEPDTEEESAPKSRQYPGFQKGGVMFVKSDTLNPVKVPEETKNGEETAALEENNVDTKETEVTYETLKEKLQFLTEGRPEISPVQIMTIQAETLFIAMKEGSLKQIYLQRWLHDTCSELVKLEKEVAPVGWSLQWDRSHKRYYYQNLTSGEGQWEYPQPDIVQFDEAMDICTTPPPPPSPPLPPTIRSPTPPPPPVISTSTTMVVNPEMVPLPPENDEPLPPGVDPAEVPIQIEAAVEVKSDKITNALDSFYSDIAAIEHSNSSPPPPPLPAEETFDFPPLPEPLPSDKKKKKQKVKLTQALSMKKKGVSKLVEKWKNVQMNYD